MVVDRAPTLSIFFAVVLLLASGLIDQHFVSTLLFNRRKELSPREITVLEWMARGKTTQEIAQIMGVSRLTIRFLLEGIRMKVGVSSFT
jgi:DNA-binding CsgD family transcriptional regulator